MKPVALIGTQAACRERVREYQKEGRLVWFKDAENVGEAVFLEVRRPFFIATTEEQLLGLGIIGFEVCGAPWSMTRVAHAMVRE